jgi:hypothetical protein
MKIYIASSWKNHHAVEMMTDRLRELDHTVISFVEKADQDEGRVTWGQMSFEDWVKTDAAKAKFYFDLDGATGSDLVIYIGPSGTDAWAEVGAAWQMGVPILGLWAKGEPSGLMRHMVIWTRDYRDIIAALKDAKTGETARVAMRARQP